MMAAVEYCPAHGSCPECGSKAVRELTTGAYECREGHVWQPGSVHKEWSL